ncbi:MULTISPECIES: hypothetical protein [Serratia]|jgi:hypothetical protein|uniref:Uncharacterized protein n=1 Tax=Serratia quinivorans TaxID=137545 RepID=A0A380A9L0_9GAMM|nr:MULTISPECIES: hypothetical protein [Serratia]RYM62618.1 hypothetical protein BSR03_09440 [Serratia proteamaculans]CAI1863550.1 Uncharacterised protein [Serratia quinivorans]SUI76853.1 Uncharacterised protein [Serratia quinivorans]
MTYGTTSGKVYTGFRKPVPATIWTPQSLFDAHKARVLAAGGVIPDEVGCLARFKFIIDNNLLDRITTWAAPAFGVKKTADNHVERLFALRGVDFIAQMQKTGEPVMYDDSGVVPSVTVRITSAGGGYLLTDSVTLYHGNPYLIGGRMADSNTADVLGITAGQDINNLSMAYMRTMIKNQQTVNEAWRCGTRDSTWKNGNPAGDALGASRSPYAAYIPAAALFDVEGGKIYGYESGKLYDTATSKTGKLADISAYSVPIYIGGGFANGEVGACYGSLREIVFLHDASQQDASLISRL